MMRRAAAAALLLAVLASGCGRSADTRTVTGDGSSTVFPITEAVAEEFLKQHRDVQVTVGVSGTGGGFKKFCNGETDLQNASRPIKDEEKEACEANGIDYVELAVANDGLAVIVNPENTWVECLTVDELNKIWEPNSSVKNWSQVRPGFPNVPLTLFGPGTDSGTFDYFTDVINGEEGASRTDYTPSEDDNVLVQGVAGSRGALGYFGFAYYEENSDKLKLLGVDGGDGCVTPSDETVRSNTYRPLSRPLFVYVAVPSIAEPEVRAFMDFYLQNVNDLVKDVGYMPLSDEQLAASRRAWEEAAGEV